MSANLEEAIQKKVHNLPDEQQKEVLEFVEGLDESAHRAEVDLLAHRVAAACKPVGGLLELGLIGADFDRLDAGHAGEVAGHAQPLVPEQDRGAVEAVIVDAMLGEQSEVENGA